MHQINKNSKRQRLQLSPARRAQVFEPHNERRDSSPLSPLSGVLQDPEQPLNRLRIELAYATRSKIALLNTQQAAMRQALEIQMLLTRLHEKINTADALCFDIGEQIFWHEQMLLSSHGASPNMQNTVTEFPTHAAMENSYVHGEFMPEPSVPA